jgi:hypothetical protein
MDFKVVKGTILVGGTWGSRGTKGVGELQIVQDGAMGKQLKSEVNLFYCKWVVYRELYFVLVYIVKYLYYYEY